MGPNGVDQIASAMPPPRSNVLPRFPAHRESYGAKKSEAVFLLRLLPQANSLTWTHKMAKKSPTCSTPAAAKNFGKPSMRKCTKTNGDPDLAALRFWMAT